MQRTFSAVKAKQKIPKALWLQGFFVGPSGEIRTHGLMVPNHARYQLRYTRMQLSYYRALSPACQA